MNITIHPYQASHISSAIDIWNTVILDGVAYPQLDYLDEKTGDEFFKSQDYTGIAVDNNTGEVVGLYILHPNNVGRCSHISNASFAVRKDMRGQKIGEKLIIHCKEQAKKCGFRLMQFNAVVKSNHSALHLYEKLGFVRLGTIPGGFRLDNDIYEDIADCRQTGLSNSGYNSVCLIF